jgi:hypothetical protein
MNQGMALWGWIVTKVGADGKRPRGLYHSPELLNAIGMFNIGVSVGNAVLFRSKKQMQNKTTANGALFDQFDDKSTLD